MNSDKATIIWQWNFYGEVKNAGLNFWIFLVLQKMHLMDFLTVNTTPMDLLLGERQSTSSSSFVFFVIPLT